MVDATKVMKHMLGPGAPEVTRPRSRPDALAGLLEHGTSLLKPRVEAATPADKQQVLVVNLPVPAPRMHAHPNFSCK